MKKIFVILLMLVYGVSSSGMTVNLHYCCGKLDNVSFSIKHKKGCAKAEGIKKSGCCNDKQFSAKLSIDQQSVVKWMPSNKDLIISPQYAAYNINFPEQVISVGKLARGAPTIHTVPLFIKNCVFRI
jgi:hypothetical protein